MLGVADRNGTDLIMSSGEQAKPPAALQERNPFDISRRSEKDVAREIAQRMAAWKQARGRSYATPPYANPGAAPNPEAKLPPISAPVQPARLPKFAEPATRPPRPADESQPRAASVASSGPEARAPFLASFSAIQRAMPPAPSLKRPAASPARPIEAPEIEAPEIEGRAVASPEAPAFAEAEPKWVGTASAGGAAVSALPGIDAADIAAARTVEARDREAERIETAGIPAPDAPPGEMSEVEIAAETRDSEAAIDSPAAAIAGTETAAPATAAIDAPDGHVGRIEPHVDALASEMPETASEAPTVDAPDSGVLQLDTPVAETPESQPAASAAPAVEEDDLEHRRIEARTIRARWIEAHDFDTPINDAPNEIAPAAAAPEAGSGDAEADSTTARGIDDAEPATPAPEALDSEIDGSERREPTLDWPRAEPASELRSQAPTIALPRIETRIETRRIATLRADPQLATRRPIFPHIEPEEWDVAPAVAARARPAGGGTGWAIGLGALLLVIGITAPAAIWQGRQQSSDQDQVALLSPVPAPSAKQAQPETPATPPEPPQPEAPPLASQTQNPAAPPEQPDDQTELDTVARGGAVNAAPIVAPPAPVQEPASKPKTQPDLATADAPEPLMIARPFIPDQKTSPFLGTPTGGTPASASIALKPRLMGQLKPQIASAPAIKAPGSAPQTVVRKPKTQNPRTLDQMFDRLIDTLSNGQPVNPANKPAAPSTRK